MLVQSILLTHQMVAKSGVQNVVMPMAIATSLATKETNMKITVNVDDDDLDTIVLDVLRDSYNMLKSAPFGDDYDSKKFRKHLRKVIQYYSTPSQYNEWREQQRGA